MNIEKIMNKVAEHHLADLAATMLQRQLGQPVRVGTWTDTPLPSRGDGELWVGEQQRFVFDAKLTLPPTTIGRLRSQRAAGASPLVLIAPYINDKLGQQLQQLGIYYLDTAGNAYLRTDDPGFLVLIRGQRQPEATRQVQHRAFQPAGVQLLYQLLSEPALLQASYRVMAERAQVALGSVSVLLRGLEQTGLLRTEGGRRRWTEPAQVLRRWVDAYGETVRPKLDSQRYRWLEPGLARHGWQAVALGDSALWGGEPAAHLLLDGYLLPEYFTLYSTAPRSELMRQLRLVPDPAGMVEVLRPLAMAATSPRPAAQAVHPLLAYADLLLTTEPRNREMAHLLHERYLSYLA
jgi:hypothetical protein